MARFQAGVDNKIDLVFSNDPLPTDVTKTIFLAGPSPRYRHGDIINREWRHGMVDELKRQGYEGTIYIPLWREWFYGVGETISSEPPLDYDHQVNWEDQAMSRADVLIFWIPRTHENLGLTTNVEIGHYLDSGRLSVGWPINAIKNDYIKHQLDKRGLKPYNSMCDVAFEAIDRIGQGAYRERDQVIVPLVIWKSAQFQTWYNNTVYERGNRLDGFKVKSIIAFNRGRSLFGFSAHVSVWLTLENRHKSNEWIFSRTSTSYVVPFYQDEQGETHFVLIREFRSPANNRFGYVFELPGGSATDSDNCDVIENAQNELFEETGLEITDLSRFEFLGNRQTFATFSTNQIVACRVALTKEEFDTLKADSESGTIFGENAEERITLYTATLKELLSSESHIDVDYTTLGIVLLAMNKE